MNIVGYRDLNPTPSPFFGGDVLVAHRDTEVREVLNPINIFGIFLGEYSVG